MAKGAVKMGGAGFLICMVVAEAYSPGSGVGIASATVDAIVPALQATGVIGGEGLKATKPIGEGAREGVSGLGLEMDLSPAATEDTLPDPLEGP